MKSLILEANKAHPELAMTYPQFKLAVDAITNARLCLIGQLIFLIPGGLLAIAGIVYPGGQIILFVAGRPWEWPSWGVPGAFLLAGGALLILSSLMRAAARHFMDQLDRIDFSKTTDG